MVAAICIGLYVLELVFQSLLTPFPLVDASADSGGLIGKLLSLLGANGYVHALFGAVGFESPWWTLVTQNFLHGGILHIAMNLMVLRTLGTYCEVVFGRWRMITLCTVSGLASSALCLAMGQPGIGLSGVLCGFLGAALLHSRRTGNMLAYGQLLHWTITIALMSFLPGISLYGHLGGFLGGFAFSWLTLHPAVPWLRRLRVVRTLAVLSITVGVAAYTGLAIEIAVQMPYRHFRPIEDLRLEIGRRLMTEDRLPSVEMCERARRTVQDTIEKVPAWTAVLTPWSSALERIQKRVVENGGEAQMRHRDEQLVAAFSDAVGGWFDWWKEHPDRYGIRRILSRLTTR
ncbi:MAG: rhomboid family intramembrane serine protease [Planctomycetes bacterium]|nr:rhomboid family intramembrane serine protease [Planctomycetota bacterium]